MKRFVFLFILFILSRNLVAGNYPIIFVHGHKSDAKPIGDDPEDNDYGWETWFPMKNNFALEYPTVMTRLINTHYGGYSAGDPLHCDKDSTPRSTSGETRKIYNFSYYHPYGNPGVIALSEESLLVYFSHGYDKLGRLVVTIFPYPPPSYDSTKYWPRYVPNISIDWVNGTYCMIVGDVSGYYVKHWKEGRYAKRLAQFIDKVLAATGASKVDIVAHSMGGLVARVAIKNYGCANKVRKLLMVGTPNRTFASWWEEWYVIWPGDKSWQKSGEDLELGVGENASFTDLSTGLQKWWHDFLGYSNYIEGMSTIAGNKGRSFYGNKPNDGVVAVEQVGLSSAQFNPVIYASHSYDGVPEIALTTCTYTTEFIKNWIIDDDMSHKGATVAGAIAVKYWRSG